MNKIILNHSYNPYENLALEDYLFQNAEGMTLYLWQNAHTIVIGRSQNAFRECRVAELEAFGGYLARRSTGGGAVYHHLGNLNFSFVCKKELYDVPRQLSVILSALQQLGIPAEFSGRNDLTSNGRKFSGNAFRESQGNCLHHGTLLFDEDMDNLTRFLTVRTDKLQSKGVQSVRSRVINLKEINPLLTLDNLIHALLAAFIHEYGESEKWDCPLSHLAQTTVHQPISATMENPNKGQSPDSQIQSQTNTAFFNAVDGQEENEDILSSASQQNPITCIRQSKAYLELLEKYQSWKWRLGENPIFNKEIVHRFPFGEIQLYLQVKNSIIESIKCYSDTLDTELAETLESLLQGCPYDVHRVAQALQSLHHYPELQTYIVQNLYE